MRPKTSTSVLVAIFAVIPVALALLGPTLLRLVGSLLGWYLHRKTDGRRAQLLSLRDADEKQYQATNTQQP